MNVDRRIVTDDFSVSPQIGPDDVAALAAAGVRLIINNRPDGEAPDQASSAEMEAAARAAGVAYRFVPVASVPPTAQEGAAMAEAARAADGPVHAFCRSGTRSIMAWAVGRAAAGEQRTDELVRLGAGAGYDLGPLFR